MSQSTSASSGEDSIPHVPPDSPGSSVSLRLQEEYDELLRYAVVIPNPTIDFNNMPGVLSSLREPTESVSDDGIITIKAKPRKADTRGNRGQEEEEEEKTPRPKEEHDIRYLPDLDQSTITSKDHSLSSSFVERGTEKTTDDSTRNFVQPMFPEPFSTEKKHAAGKKMLQEVYAASLDPDVGHLEMVMDHWCLELKRKVLAEFSQSKLIIVQQTQQEVLREKQRHAAEKNEIVGEMNSIKELLHTYEQSMERKDQIVSNLTAALHRHRDKLELMRKFSDWRLQHNDAKCEAFATNLARKHFEKKLCKRVLSAWFSTIHSNWKQRMEKACQTKAQEVCRQLTVDYEAKISSLNDIMDGTKQEVRRLHVDRERYEEAMKKAFMRGVCALNMEAMSIFHEEDARDSAGQHLESNGNSDDFSGNMNGTAQDKTTCSSKVLPQDAGLQCQASDLVTAKGVPPQGSRLSAVTQPSQVSAKPTSSSSGPSHGKGRTLSVRITGKTGETSRHWNRSHSPTLDPPMASVVVERHQPVTKQTIGHATASKYPKVSAENAAFKRLAGQGDPTRVVPHVQTVHVVE